MAIIVEVRMEGVRVAVVVVVCTSTPTTITTAAPTTNNNSKGERVGTRGKNEDARY